MTGRTANIIGGLLIGFGTALFFGMLAMALYWTGQAPDMPNPARGLIHPFDNHGHIIYQNAFQAHAVMPLAFGGVAISNFGWLITPKRRRGGANRFDRDDKSWMKIVPLAYAPASYTLGALVALAPLALVFVIYGP